MARTSERTLLSCACASVPNLTVNNRAYQNQMTEYKAYGICSRSFTDTLSALQYAKYKIYASRLVIQESNTITMISGTMASSELNCVYCYGLLRSGDGIREVKRVGVICNCKT